MIWEISITKTDRRNTTDIINRRAIKSVILGIWEVWGSIDQAR
jgi:hypothetical protein